MGALEPEPAIREAERHLAGYAQMVQTFLRGQEACSVDLHDGPSPALGVALGSALPSSPPRRKRTQRARRMACDSRFPNPHLARGASLRDRQAFTARLRPGARAHERSAPLSSWLHLRPRAGPTPDPPWV